MFPNGEVYKKGYHMYLMVVNSFYNSLAIKNSPNDPARWVEKYSRLPQLEQIGIYTII